MSSFLVRTLTRRGFLAGAGATAAATTLGCSQPSNGSAGGSAKQAKLAIIHTNDSHGHDLLDGESLGLAAAAQLKKDYQAKGYDVLLLDAGDAVQGENLVNCSQGDTAIDFMNSCGYDAMALGNHEFDYGQHKIEDYRKAATFPLLSANTIVKATGDPLVEDRVTLTTESGLHVGVFGLTTPETYTKVSPLVVKGLNFLAGDELYECAQQQVDALRAEGVDLVVCLAHLGEDDVSAPNRAQDVVGHVQGIDLLIDAHDHNEEEARIKDAAGKETLVVETGCYTHAVGVVTWEDGKLASTLERFGEYEGQDEQVAGVIQTAKDELDADLGEVVATTPFDLDGNRQPGVRTQETNLGDLIADAVLWEATRMAEDTPDLAIINAGAIRDSISKGDITMGNVVSTLPFINYICTVQVSGAQLLEALEAACASTPKEMGSFPQVAGITFEINTKNKFEADGTYPDSMYEKPANPGGRVTITDVGGRGFSPDDTYVVAAQDFTCAGGDTYYVFAEAAQTTMKSTNYLCGDCVIYYLEEQLAGEVSAEYEKPQGRITVRS